MVAWPSRRWRPSLAGGDLASARKTNTQAITVVGQAEGAGLGKGRARHERDYRPDGPTMLQTFGFGHDRQGELFLRSASWPPAHGSTGDLRCITRIREPQQRIDALGTVVGHNVPRASPPE